VPGLVCLHLDHPFSWFGNSEYLQECGVTMNSVSIGIHVHADPQRLQATLAALRAHSRSARLLLLPDGPDASTIAVLKQIDLPQLATSEPQGPAACFNRLAASTGSDVIVFLESGCVVGPGWLDALLTALDSHPQVGLAGPSTNLSWNEQNAFPNALGTPTAVAHTARTASQRFGSECRTLEPLYSLADFCYAVKRSVMEKIGAADEGYGLGPCWEMDYNIRAQRAGFRGVWACSSYVYRAPLAGRRAKEEQRRFPASRKLYQDKFCGLRLTGTPPAYEPHCRGEVCEHFAPAALVQLSLPLPAAQKLPDITIAPPATVNSQAPELVSCIMVTRDRPEFVLQSIRYFQRQDYPHRELIILDDGTGDLTGSTGNDDRIRYIKLPNILSIGAKRNRACELARGSYIAHWDDDDWYASNRLSRQLAPLIDGSADITALRANIFFDLRRWKFWQCTDTLHRRLFVEDVHGGTLVYKRACWEDFSRFPNISLAEDAVFLRRVIQRGSRLKRLPNDGAFIYLRHPGNAWRFECGTYLDPKGWSPAPEPELPAEDRSFYAARASSISHGSAVRAMSPNISDGELVSCIMPTSNRRLLVPQAIRYFLSQDYPNSELIVVDDGTDSVADLMPQDSRIRYVRLARRHTIGAKRNIACDHAKGKVIVHWDDDDWISSRRLSYQLKELSVAAASSVCGLSRVFYFDPCRRRAWLYVYPDGRRHWLAGNTLCYYKELWREHPFPDVNVGEDARFIWSLPESSVLSLTDSTFYVATVHASNSSRKRTQDVYWQPCPIEEIDSILGADSSFYREWPLAATPANR